MTRPTIHEAYARLLAMFRQHNPGGEVIASDRAYLMRATARDAGVTVDEAREAIEGRG